MAINLCTLPRDVLHLLADRYVSFKDRKALRCLSKHFHSTIASAPAIGPSQELFRNVYKWDRYVCWWCLHLGSLTEIDWPETNQFDDRCHSSELLDYDSIRNQWFQYETCVSELQDQPLFCRQCYANFPMQLFQMIFNRYYLGLNIMVNAKWRKLQSIGKDDRQREYLKKSSHKLENSLFLLAIREEKISVYNPFSPIGVKVKEQKTSFLLTWNYCPECHWHGQALDRCQECAQLFHIGGNPNCSNGKRGHISELEKEAHADTTQQQLCLCEFCRDGVPCGYCKKRLCWSEIRFVAEEDAQMVDDDQDRYSAFCADCYRKHIKMDDG